MLSGLVEASYYYEDVDEDDVDEDSVLASILQDQRQQQRLGENNREDQNTRNGRPKTPLLKSVTNATRTTTESNSDAKQQAIKNRRRDIISHSQTNNQQQQQQQKWPTNNPKQPPPPPIKTTIVMQQQQQQQQTNNPAKLSTTSFVAKNSDNNEDHQLASAASTKGTDNDRAFTTTNSDSNSNHDGNQQVPVVRLQATNNTDTILRQVKTVGSDLDSTASPDTNTWEKPIHETSTNDTVLAWEQHDNNNNIDPAVSSLLLDRPTSLSSTIINPYRNTTIRAINKNDESTSKTAAMDTNKMVATASTSRTPPPLIPNYNATLVDSNTNNTPVISATFLSTTPKVIKSNGTTIKMDTTTTVAATPDTTTTSTPTVNTVSPANKNKTITATLTTTPVIPKSTNGMNSTNVNTETTGTASAVNILPHVLNSTTKPQSSSFNERLAAISKPSSIWSKLGIPSKRPVNNKMMSIPNNQNSEEASSSDDAVLDDKLDDKKKKITFWSSLVHDLHTAPTIVVPENASWSANSIRDSTSSALKYTRGSEDRRKDR